MGGFSMDNEGNIETAAEAAASLEENRNAGNTLHFECGNPACPVMAKPCRLVIRARSTEYAPMDDSCPEFIEDACIWIKADPEPEIDERSQELCQEAT